MLCEICGNKVKTKRTILNLFDPEIHHICENCYMQYPLTPRNQVIPIEDGIIHHYSMMRNEVKNSGIAYMSFMKPYVVQYMMHYDDFIFLYKDEIDEDFLTILDSLKLGNIYLLTLYENIKKG
ncbi:MAG: hypothetical protein V1920_03650, partial [Bacillota bacterium]